MGPSVLFVVARDEPELYRHLVEHFDGIEAVTVILDRRAGAVDAGHERRVDERRSLDAAFALQRRGWLVFRRNTAG